MTKWHDYHNMVELKLKRGNFIEKNLVCMLTHSNGEPVSYAFAMDCATTICFFFLGATELVPKKIKYRVIDLLFEGELT